MLCQFIKKVWINIKCMLLSNKKKVSVRGYRFIIQFIYFSEESKTMAILKGQRSRL